MNSSIKNAKQRQCCHPFKNIIISSQIECVTLYLYSWKTWCINVLKNVHFYSNTSVQLEKEMSKMPFQKFSFGTFLSCLKLFQNWISTSFCVLKDRKIYFHILKIGNNWGCIWYLIFTKVSFLLLSMKKETAAKTFFD